MMGLDIGPETAKLYAQRHRRRLPPCSGTAPWACSRCDAFAAGTKAVAEAVAENEQGDTIIGGGDSVAAVNKFDLADQMTFISTGGGASHGAGPGRSPPRRGGPEALR